MQVTELLMRIANGQRTLVPFPRDSGALVVQRTYLHFPSGEKLALLAAATT